MYGNYYVHSCNVFGNPRFHDVVRCLDQQLIYIDQDTCWTTGKQVIWALYP